jgi:hypothetical protein
MLWSEKKVVVTNWPVLYRDGSDRNYKTWNVVTERIQKQNLNVKIDENDN